MPLVRPALAALVAVAALVGVAASHAAQGATPAQNAAFAKELRAELKPKFAKQAPQLVLGAVDCTIDASRTSARCQAHFTDPTAKVDVVYAVAATPKGTDSIDWTAGSDVCTYVPTGKRIAC